MIRFRFTKVSKRYRGPIPIVDNNDNQIGMTSEVWFIEAGMHTIAQCDTEKEADEVIAELNKLIGRYHV